MLCGFLINVIYPIDDDIKSEKKKKKEEEEEEEEKNIYSEREALSADQLRAPFQNILNKTNSSSPTLISFFFCSFLAIINYQL
jgi:hypothetical protein